LVPVRLPPAAVERWIAPGQQADPDQTQPTIHNAGQLRAFGSGVAATLII